MSKDLEIKHCVGVVKKDCSEKMKSYMGLELFIVCDNQHDEGVIISPIEIDQMERFYKIAYDSGMKDIISDDYEYCIWYLAGEDCELVPHIKISDLENFRDATKEDMFKFENNFNEFKKIHKFAEREQAMKEQEEKEKVAVEEFKNIDKVDFNVRTRNEPAKVKAIIYRGFAIHDSIDISNPEESIYKEITVAEGEYSGIKLLSCNILDYKKCIDEIRALIGDKPLEISDLDVIKPMIKKY